MTGLFLVGFSRWITTESLAISFSMIFCGLMISYLKSPSYSCILGIHALVLLMVMLRPVFIYLIILLFLFWLARMALSSYRYSAFIGFLNILIIASLVFGYCELNKKNHGFFGISTVGTFNQLSRIICFGFYKNGSNTEINEFIEKQNVDSSYPIQSAVYRELCKHWNQREIQTYANQTFKKNFLPLCLLAGKNMWWESYKNFWLLCYFMGIADLIFTIFLSVYFRQIAWIRLGTWGMFYGLIAVIYLNTTCDYVRLCSPCLPILYLLIFRYGDLLYFASNYSRDEVIEYLKSTL